MSRVVQYGTQAIEYSVKVRDLEHHYVEVSADEGVVLKGRLVAESEADKLILMRAGWILEKQQDVAAGLDQLTGEIVTGSRIMYLGRRYFTEVTNSEHLHKIARVKFLYSKFEVIGNTAMDWFQDSAEAGLTEGYGTQTSKGAL